MDRSFLSDAAVIAASRDFVCVRLATYEDAEEGALLASIFTGRSGRLENTVFAILAPDGKKQLVRAGRSPDFAFRGPEEIAVADMAKSMRAIAERFPAKKSAAAATPELPDHKDLRRALNIASCDLRPLVVVAGETAKAADALAQRLASHAWGDDLIGRAEYVRIGALAELKALKGATNSDAGFLVVAPDAYGLSGRVLSQVPATVDDEKLLTELKRSLHAFEPGTKKPRGHIRDGRRKGVHWETEIPVTDPHGPPDGADRRRPPPDGDREHD